MSGSPLTPALNVWSHPAFTYMCDAEVTLRSASAHLAEAWGLKTIPSGFVPTLFSSNGFSTRNPKNQGFLTHVGFGFTIPKKSLRFFSMIQNLFFRRMFKY